MFKRFDIEKNRIHIVSLSCNTVPPKKYGGIELVVANLCQGLAELGAKITCYSPGEFNIADVNHIQTLPLPTTGIKDGGVANSKAHLESVFKNLKKETRIGDVVIFNHPQQFRYLKKKLRFQFLMKLNCFEIAHTIDAGLYKNIIYPSKSLMASIQKPGFVAHHGIKLIFAKEQINRGSHLFYAGSIDADKGVNIALEVCRNIGCELVIAGPRKNTEFESNILSDSIVNYLGELSYPELHFEYLRAAALIYMTQINEPFGLVPVEALAAGCPVITTGKGGTGETVINNKSGFHCNSIDDVIEAYNNIHKIEHQSCIQQASKFSIKEMSKKYLSIINNQGYSE